MAFRRGNSCWQNSSEELSSCEEELSLLGHQFWSSNQQTSPMFCKALDDFPLCNENNVVKQRKK
jgi:hypothetical protein